MAFVHGKDTKITLNASDLSAFTNTSALTRTADSHDVTTYGQSTHVYAGGLKDGTASMGGIYDNAVTGPKDTIDPLIGTVVELVRQPEGVGVGKPTDTVQVLVTQYVETSPVADMVSWTVELQLSGPVVTTAQI